MSGAGRETSLRLPRGLPRTARPMSAGEADFGNPVQDYAPDALRVSSQVAVRPGSRESKPSKEAEEAPQEPALAVDSEPGDTGGTEPTKANTDLVPEAEAEPGFLELAMAMQEGNEQTAAAGTETGSLTETIGDALLKETARLDQVQKNLGSKAGQVLLGIMRDTAKVLDQYSDSVEPLNIKVRDAVTDVARGANAIAGFRRDEASGDVESLQGEIASVAAAEESMAEAYVSISGFAILLGSLPNMESHLTRACQRAGRAVFERQILSKPRRPRLGGRETCCRSASRPSLDLK